MHSGHGRSPGRSMPSPHEDAQAAQMLCNALMEANLDEFHCVVAKALTAYDHGEIESDAVAGYVAHAYINMILCNEKLQRSSQVA